jgi:hypothetical protein
MASNFDGRGRKGDGNSRRQLSQLCIHSRSDRFVGLFRGLPLAPFFERYPEKVAVGVLRSTHHVEAVDRSYLMDSGGFHQGSSTCLAVELVRGKEDFRN